MVLIKTLKKSEFDIMFDNNGRFLKSYYEYICKEKPDSLLAKILGVFEVKISGKEPIKFFITENMIENDFHAVKRCYDLKGSKFSRIVELDLMVEISGETGLKVLKD